MRVKFCRAKLAAAPSSPMAEDRAASYSSWRWPRRLRIIRSCGFWQQLDANPVGVGEWSLRCGVDRGRGRSVL